jgi:hypothetical protein
VLPIRRIVKEIVGIDITGAVAARSA